MNDRRSLRPGYYCVSCLAVFLTGQLNRFILFSECHEYDEQRLRRERRKENRRKMVVGYFVILHKNHKCKISGNGLANH